MNIAADSKTDFTVLLAVYHRDDPKQFDRALASIFSNTLSPTGVIVVADGPLTEQLDAVLSCHAAKQRTLRIHRLRVNGGLAKALNEGFSIVSTEWVVRADADDINHPDRFQKQVDLLASQNYDIDLMGGAISEVDRDGRLLAVRRTPTSHNAIVRFGSRRNPFNHMTVWYRTELARRVGGYPDIHLKEDYALWAAMIKAGARCANLDEPLVDALTGQEMYRRRGGMLYALAEIKLQKHLYKTGLKSAPLSLFDVCSRAAVFLAPAPVREIVYKHILRSRRPLSN